METGNLGLWVCAAIVVLSAITDVASRKIPNILTLGGIAFGFALHVAMGYADAGMGGVGGGVGQAALGMFVCSIFPVVSFARGAMGGGDVKLFAAIGAIAGYRIGLDTLAATLVVMLVVLLPFRLLRAGLVGAALRNARTAFSNAFRPASERAPYASTKVPGVIMGPAILLGFCVAIARQWPHS